MKVMTARNSEFAWFGTYALQDAERLLERFEKENVKFQIDADTHPGPANIYAARPPRSNISIFVHRDDDTKARAIFDKLFSISMSSPDELGMQT
jgi:hypothetical protein